MAPIIGPPVRGADLYGRDAFIQRLWQALEGNSVLLVAPRRFGKTSVMHALCDQPQKPWKAVYIDAEHTRTPAEFAVALIRKCWEADRSWRTALARGFEGAKSWCEAAVSAVGLAASPDTHFWLELRKDMGREWETRALALLQTLRTADAHVVFAVDELAVMLENFADAGRTPADVRSFMRWFRHLRIDPGDGLRNCRFLLGSSIGVENTLSRMGAIDTVNDLQAIVLEELTPQDARRLFSSLLDAAGVPLSPRAAKTALSLVGPPVPYFIQIIADAIICAHGRGSKLGPKTVEALYVTEVLGNHSRTYFQHYYDRLRRHEPVDHELALGMLRYLAEVHCANRSALWGVYARLAEARRTEEDFRRMLAELQNDFYIRPDRDTDDYVFWSNILRDWWRRHYCI